VGIVIGWLRRILENSIFNTRYKKIFLEFLLEKSTSLTIMTIDRVSTLRTILRGSLRQVEYFIKITNDLVPENPYRTTVVRGEIEELKPIIYLFHGSSLTDKLTKEQRSGTLGCLCGFMIEVVTKVWRVGKVGLQGDGRKNGYGEQWFERGRDRGESLGF
nr:hypothetical protein [Tanacetum cinerariifolium]